MYISKLSVYGFKSFLKKSDVIFGKGVTSIVGPNGCGKTNIVDAIRWVIGEQKSSVLRADRNTDVIFNGTATRRPLNFAEVSLTIHNDKGKIDIDYSDIVITRRVYRNGESEYFINKNLCRLKDITDLFIDTGMGANAYSIIELKMIEDILSESPEERKRLFEEAAGVNKYRVQRRAAIRKLDAVKDDLLRLNDIINEVDAKVRNLKRQLKRYNQYQDVSQLLVETEVQLASRKVFNIRNKTAPMQEQQVKAKDALQKITEQLSKLEEFYKQQEERLAIEENLFQEKNEVLEKIKSERHDVQTKSLVLREQLKNFKNSIERINKEDEEYTESLKRTRQRLEEAEKTRNELNAVLKDKRGIFKSHSEEQDVVEQAYKKISDEVQQLQDQRYQLVKQQAEYDARFTNLHENIEQREKDIQDLTQKIRERTAKQVELDKHKNTISQNVAQLKTDLEDTRDILESENRLLEEGREAEQKLIEELRIVNSQADKINNQIEFYSNIIQSKEGFDPGLQYVVDNQVEFPGIKGALSDLISADSQFYLAVETVLKDISRLLVADTREQALDALAKLSKLKKGKVSIIPADVVHPKNSQTIKVSGVEPLANRIKCSSQMVALKQTLFGHIYCCADEDFSRLLNLPEMNGVSLVSDKGRFSDESGILSGGQDSTESNVLVGRSERLYELETAFDKLEQEKRGIEDQLEKVREDLRNTKIRHEEALRVINENEKEFRAKENELRYADRQIFESGSILKRLEENRLSVKVALENFRSRIEKEDPEKQIHIEKITELDKNLEARRNELADAKTKMDDRNREIQNERIELVTRENEYRNVIESIESMNRSIRNLSSRQEQAQEDKKIYLERITQNEEKAINAETTFKQLDEQVKKEEVDVNKLRENYQKLRRELHDLNEQIYQIRHQKEKDTDSLSKLELTLAEFLSGEKEIRSVLNQKYDRQLLPDLPEDMPSEEDLENKVKKNKHKLELIGMVNMAVKDEYESEDSRLKFLTEQRDDLLESEKGINEVIDRIDNIAREQYLEVFAQINENFKSTFNLFFDGGEADLKLSDNEEPLDAQIEIFACPTGKKMRSLKMLSAGEKTLTAIALLFGIYQVKPSPFCILDEVDAPLDDSNTRRFTRMIKAFSDKTQFIIVTHNKVTMSVGDVLYGVTMGERGVSQVVSVKMNQM